MIERIRITIDLSVLCLIYQNYMKIVRINKSVKNLNHFYQSFNAVSDKNSVHNCLLGMVEKLKTIRDNKGVFAAVLADISKAFDCITHGLVIAKLNAFGLDKNRKQKFKVSSECSQFLNIHFGIPQGWILGPILFITFIEDLFFINKDIDFLSYGDDATP